jgi:hypothetical protein
MISAAHVNKIFERGLWVIERQVEGLTHEDSLLQPEFRANCMNWVLGHILWERQAVLELLGRERNVSREELVPYEYESAPIAADSPDVIRLEVMLQYIQESGKRMAEGFANLDEKAWLGAINDKGTQMWERAEFLAWHEAYHVGQLELLRQLAGKDDKVI